MLRLWPKPPSPRVPEEVLMGEKGGNPELLLPLLLLLGVVVVLLLPALLGRERPGKRGAAPPAVDDVRRVGVREAYAEEAAPERGVIGLRVFEGVRAWRGVPAAEGEAFAPFPAPAFEAAVAAAASDATCAAISASGGTFKASK